MAFDAADYRRASARLDVPDLHIMAMAAVESSGETFWDIGGRLLPPVRLEAHWFGKLTGYRFNAQADRITAHDRRFERVEDRLDRVGIPPSAR